MVGKNAPFKRKRKENENQMDRKREMKRNLDSKFKDRVR